MLVYTALNAFNSAMSGATSGALIGLFGALLSLAFGAESLIKSPPEMPLMVVRGWPRRKGEKPGLRGNA